MGCLGLDSFISKRKRKIKKKKLFKKKWPLWVVDVGFVCIFVRVLYDFLSCFYVYMFVSLCVGICVCIYLCIYMKFCLFIFEFLDLHVIIVNVSVFHR